MSNLIPVRRALISVSDKSGLLELGAALERFGVEILSTGGTAKTLRGAGIAVTDVADHTGFPEMMDGRVKTLHPKIHGGILALRDNPDHSAAMDTHNIGAIDLVVINLYPFEQTVSAGAEADEIIENIDIGGPAMIRSAAKNHAFVSVIVDPDDYTGLIGEMDANDGATTIDLRQNLAAKAFTRTASYDAAIQDWFWQRLGVDEPDSLLLAANKQQRLRYGENPHQQAAFYKARGDNRTGVATAIQLQGKELSYNNLNDTNAAFELISEFPPGEGPVVAIIKHANPCGVAKAATLVEAYKKALACDSISAFGGIIACNQALDEETAREIAKIFTEVVIAPGISAGARKILSAKKNLRLLETKGLADPAAPGRTVKSIAGGYLVQNRDNGRLTRDQLKIVTRKKPTDAEFDDLLFAFTVAKHVKSNAIVYARDGMTVGVGAGQMNRRDSSRIAALRAGEAAALAGDDKSFAVGSVVASDAFFPFADGLLAAAEAGAIAVIQPGGSMRDDEVIDAADKAGIAMVFTGMRHFNH
jgi:phosphoribosylaminoimidazolecarboxamide formyltransferase / IMP cyclohydrolase